MEKRGINCSFVGSKVDGTKRSKLSAIFDKKGQDLHCEIQVTEEETFGGKKSGFEYINAFLANSKV